jgi:hypothetical protein
LIIASILFKHAKKVFFDKWLEKKDVWFLLSALTNIKRNENETIDEFDKRFDNIVQDIPQTHQPTADTILMYYMNAFQGNFSFFLHTANPTTLALPRSMPRVLMKIGISQGSQMY